MTPWQPPAIPEIARGGPLPAGCRDSVSFFACMLLMVLGYVVCGGYGWADCAVRGGYVVEWKCVGAP